MCLRVWRTFGAEMRVQEGLDLDVVVAKVRWICSIRNDDCYISHVNIQYTNHEERRRVRVV